MTARGFGESSKILVIFDCDGVLVDSERIANPLLAKLLSDEGLPTTPEQSVARYQGRAWKDCSRVIEEQLGRPLPVDFQKSFHDGMMEEFHRSLTPMPGLAVALDCIDSPMCVASSSGHVHIRTVLEITGLYPRFEGRCFSASEVSRGKPHPDLFLHAAERMGFSPETSVVVEDSLFGVQAARAAGMRVLGFARDTEPTVLLDAGARVFHKMEELPELIAAMHGQETAGRVGLG